MDTTTNHELSKAPSGSTLEDVRTRVLVEHARLRAVITDVDQLAAAVAAGESHRLEDLRERAGRLYRMLELHIDHEDEIVAPIVARIDAWGSIRHEQMKQDHEGQRILLKQAIFELGIEGRPLGQAIQSLCWEILHDMRREEHDLLHPDLWRERP